MPTRISVSVALFFLLYGSPGVAYLEDVSERSGIRFTHTNGARFDAQSGHSRYMPETMGSGVAIFDFDNDGDNDILFVNSTGFGIQVPPSNTTMALYENLGNWRFTDVTEKFALRIPLYAMGASIADFDSDGDKDILITTIDGIRLFAKAQDHYQDVTLELNLRYPRNTGREKIGNWATGAVFFDADGDKDLDILAVHYLGWSMETDIFTSYDTENKGYTSPRSYRGQTLRIWLQNKGKFTDATPGSGLNIEGKSLGVSLWDFNNDRLLDIFVANDTIENFLFTNLGSGKFKNIGFTAEVAYDRHGNARAGMGVDIADIHNNGRAAIAIGNFSGEPTSLFQQKATWKFTEDSTQTRIADLTMDKLTFGLAIFDLDLDGLQDIVTANGHVEPNIQNAFPEQQYRQPIQFIKNRGNQRFSQDLVENSALSTPMVGRGLAYGDLDNDGDIDFIVSGNNQAPRIIRNNISARDYLRIHLIGQTPNIDAIGARIFIEGAHFQQQRMVRTGSSYLSQSELIQTFGLEKHGQVKALKVVWPDGTVQYIKNPKINRTLTLYQQPQGKGGHHHQDLDGSVVTK